MDNTVFSIIYIAIGTFFIFIPRDMMERYRIWSRSYPSIGNLLSRNKPITPVIASFIHMFGALILIIGLIILYSSVR